MGTFSEPVYTPDDLLTMPDGDRYELVDGHLVEHHRGAWAVHVASQLMILIAQFDRDRKLGWILMSDASYQCFPNGRVRMPDLSFIRVGRLPGKRVPIGHIKIAPDLAIEVISPTDIAHDVDGKVDEYLRAGVRLVWVVNPEVRTVLIYRLDGSIIGLREADHLDGEDMIPGFRCPVADLFHSPEED